MKPNTKFMRTLSNLQSGFSLTELMIGLALGTIAAAAIFSSLFVFEKQRRTIGSGADMQQNGLLAMYAVEQDTRDAGFGLIDSTSKPGKLPCTTINAYLPTLVSDAANPPKWALPAVSVRGGSTFTSSPVVISNNTGLNNSDTITLHRFNSDTGGIVTGGQAATLALPDVALTSNTAPPTVTVDMSSAFHVNDFILIADNGTCGLLQVTGIPSNTTLTTQLVDNPSGRATAAFATTYTTAGLSSIINLGQPASSVPGSVCPLGTERPAGTTMVGVNTTTGRYCSAPVFGSSLYQIDANHDLMLTKDGGTPTSVAGNIVDMQAQYGISDVGKQPVTCWTDATGTGCNLSDTTNDPATGTAHDWSHPGYNDVVRIKAIRVAIVARSAKMENCNTTTVDPVTWTKPVTNPVSSDPPVISLSTSVGNDWGCYRYKVYQTIIPLRNVIWGTL